MATIEPTGKTAMELDEELNARRNCPHPESAVVVDEHAIGGAQGYCNLCESYL